jgi:hypothetical protein
METYTSEMTEKVEELDNLTWQGIQSLLDHYAIVEDGDHIIIAYTPDCRNAAAWVALACEERGFQTRMLFMMPLRDKGFHDRLQTEINLSKKIAKRIMLFMFENETMSHNVVVKKIFASFDSNAYKVIRGINTGKNLFKYGLSEHPDDLSALNATILERCKTATQLRIKTENGTDLKVQLNNSKFKYMSNRGVGRPGKFIVIPSGEVATFPETINGTLVADFAINVNMILREDVRLEYNPVTVEIKNGKMVSYSCQDEKICAFLDKCFSIENTDFVGELGFGTNRGVLFAVRENSHLNERVPGVHLGFGQHNQTPEAAGYDCDIHIDLCAIGGKIWFDDQTEPLDLSQVPYSTIPHSELVNCQDVFSDDAEDDCCGLLRD